MDKVGPQRLLDEKINTLTSAKMLDLWMRRRYYSNNNSKQQKQLKENEDLHYLKLVLHTFITYCNNCLQNHQLLHFYFFDKSQLYTQQLQHTVSSL